MKPQIPFLIAICLGLVTLITLIVIRENENKLAVADCTDWASSSGETFSGTSSRIIESVHDYCDNLNISQHYFFDYSAFSAIQLFFDDQTNMEDQKDILTISYVDGKGATQIKEFTGETADNLLIPSTSFDLSFETDSSHHSWGYKFTATPLVYTSCSEFAADEGTTFDTLQPQIVESSHPYCANMTVNQHYNFTASQARDFVLAFDNQSYLDIGDGSLEISYTNADGPSTQTLTGDLPETVEIASDWFDLSFSSLTEGYLRWGYRFTVLSAKPITCSEFYSDHGTVFDTLEPQIIQSSHPYCNNMDVTQEYDFTHPDVVSIILTAHSKNDFGLDCGDSLSLSGLDEYGRNTNWYGQGLFFNSIVLSPGPMTIHFRSDSSGQYWGYHFTVTFQTAPWSSSSTTSSSSIVANSEVVKHLRRPEKIITPKNAAVRMMLMFKQWKTMLKEENK
mmetsp:Transcript_24451/g.27781  ORF Transcript_24451/g.27781 Transcript_24451/m.27781 type:complete len:450 (-) Transcript_24451:295-1644(-)